MSKLITRRILHGTVILVIPVLIFLLVNLSTGILAVNQVISNGNRDLAYIFIPLILFTLAYQRKGWRKYIYITGLLSISYALFLKWNWTIGYTTVPLLWGFLPTSDTITYYQEAYGLLLGNALMGPATFRPISTLFFSSLLWISNLNPMTMLWITAYLNVLGSLVASNEVRKTHGSLAAALYLIGGLLFYQFYIGTMMTEQLGFLLGNLAFACIWNGIRTNSLKKVLFGLYILSLGLNVRAGAMFILLALPVWIGFHFGGKKFSYKWAGIALLIALSGFLTNFLVIKIFTQEDGTMFSNFGFTLYGVAVGNKGWFQITLDHPGVTAAESTRVALQQILSNPLLFLKGVLNSYVDYFNPSTWWAFSYLKLAYLPKNIVVFVFFLLGGGYMVKNWKKPIPFFLIFAIVGIFLSVPFAPTRDAGYRTYTVTNPILFSVLFMSFPWFKQLWGRFRRQKVGAPNQIINHEHDSVFKLAYPLIAGVIVMALVVPLFTFTLKPLLPSKPQLPCAVGDVSVSFLTNRNAWIHIVPEEKLPQGISIPYATLKTLTNLINKSVYHQLRNFTDSLNYAKPGNSIGYVPFYNSYGLQEPTFDLVGFIVNTEDLPQTTGLVQFCGRNVTSKTSEINYLQTFIATNINENCATCKTIIYKPWMDNRSVYSLTIIVVYIFLDCVYSYFRERKYEQISRE